VSAPRADADSTLMLGDLPNFSLPSLFSPPAPGPPSFTPAPTPAPQPPPAAGGLPPLKIIAPPRPAERTRPPSRPSKDDLAALDELLGKRSPEGPLTPLQKPAEEWKPTFLPPQPTRGRKQKSGGGKVVMLAVVGLLAVAATGGGWMLWSNRTAQPVKAAANPPTVASASPAASVASAAPSAPASSGAAAPAPSVAPSSPPVAAKASAAPLPSPSATVATTVPAAKPTSPPLAPPKAASPPGKPAAKLSLAESGSLLRRGQFDEAARGFQANLKEGKATHSVQVLLACSTDTMDKVVKSVQAEDLFLVPIFYKGKNCYRVGWGLYDSEAKAKAGIRSVPGYFTAEKNKPKVVTLAEMLR
jgi:hypothetical protein